MSDFHYVRTHGPDGGVDAADGRAIGLDLRSVLAEGCPPFNVAFTIITSLAEILSIAEEDDVVHGDIELADVLIDETGAVSLEGFGREGSVAPEGRSTTTATDRYGLGRVAFALLEGAPLQALPTSVEGHENATIDAVLGVDLEELPEEVVSDVQWYLARLLAWDPGDRPAVTDAWRTFNGIRPIGPDFVRWCTAALDGGGQRRDRVGVAAAPWNDAASPSRRDGPMGGTALDFGASRPAARSTGSWTRDGMKEAIQRVMASDYLEDPNTDWMPGTPLPSIPREGVPRAADDFRRASAPRGAAPPRPGFSGAFDEDFDAVGPTDDSKTEVGSLSVPTNRPVAPARPKRTFVPDPPTVPAPSSDAVHAQARNAPARPSRGPARDPDTAPQLVARPSPSAAGGAAEPEPPPLVAPPVGAPEEPAPPAELPPLPQEVSIPQGPDPFAGMEEDNSGTYVVWGAVALFVVVAIGFCLGVGGVSGIAVFGMQAQGTGFERPPEGDQPLSVGRTTQPPPTEAPDPRPAPPIQPRRVGSARPGPAPRPAAPTRPVPRPAPGGFATPRPDRVAARPAPRPAPDPAPTSRPSFTTPSRRPSLPSSAPGTGFQPPPPAPPAGSRFGNRSERPLPTFDDTPAPKPVAVAPRPGGTGFTKPPSLPVGDDGSIVGALLPATVEVDPQRPKSLLQSTMLAHLGAATAARDAVIRGDADAARSAVRSLGLINPPEALPPEWAPYVADMKMEAWLMENSPDIPAAAFKIAQIGQSCAVCHAGVNAGPTVTPDRIPPRQFTDADVMKQHGWASDWMWVGLLANDDIAWNRGAAELDQSPFPSVVHADFPEQRFMDLEDRLHQLAAEAKRARTPDQRGVAFGRILATCSRCHDAYREVGGAR